jgi:transposase
MPHGKQLGDTLKRRVVAAHESGEGYKKLAKRFNLHHSTVRSIVHKWKRDKTTRPAPRSGRPRKISARTARNLVRAVTEDPTVTARDLQQQLIQSGIRVHKSTVQRALKRNGLRGCIARKKPLLKKQHRDARLQFALTHLSHPDTYWQRVLWTDETKIELFSSVGKQYVWRHKNTAFNEKT